MARRILLLLLLGLGLFLAGIFVLRATLVEALLVRELSARGLAVGSLTVTRVGLEELHLAELSLGDGEELQARALHIAFQAERLLKGDVDAVAVEGLVLRLNLAAAEPFGNLRPLLAQNDRGPPVALPTLELRAARIEAETPLGPMTATLDGEAWPEDGGALAGAFSFGLVSQRGRLSGAFDITRAPSGAMSGNLVVEDGALALPGVAAAGLLGEARYGFASGLPPELEASLTAASVTLPGAATDSARISLRASETNAAATARLGNAEGPWSLTLDVALDDYLAVPTLRLELGGSAEAGVGLWSLLGLAEPAAGRTSFRIEADGGLAPLADLARDDAALADWLERATLEGELAARVAGLAYPGRVETVGGKCRFAVRLAGGRLEFRPARPARLALVGLDPDWLRELGLPEPAVPLLERGVNLILDARGRLDRGGLAGPFELKLRTPGGAELDAASELRFEFGEDGAFGPLDLGALRVAARRLPLPGLRLNEATAQGALAGVPPDLAGDLELDIDAGEIAVQDLRAARARANLPVSLETGPGSLALRATGPGQVALDQIGYGETLRLAGLRATVSAAEASYGEGVLDHAARLSFAPAELRANDLAATLAPGLLRLRGSWSPGAPYRGELRLEPSSLTLPARNLVAEGVAAKLALGAAPEGLAAELILGTISHRAEAPLFAPLAGRLNARRDGEAVTFEGHLGDRGGAARLAIAGRHDPVQRRGAVALTLNPLGFAPGALQPAALAPPLAELRQVTGGLRARAEVAWSPEGLTSGATVAVDDLSFDSDAAEVRDLDLSLTLASLMPPASAPGQRLTVGRIDPGVALDEAALSFQIHSGDPPRLGIERGQVRLSGGQVLLRDLLLDPAAPRLELPLEVAGLDLAELFRILDIEGLSGSGRLSGRIPIAFEGAAVTIAKGRLVAEAPGTLRFESEPARQALAAAGESAELMLRALQDFRYDELSLTIDKPATAGARLTLSLLGHNPAVLDGYPFRFNINLEGETDRLVAALSQAYSLSNRMLRQFWRPKRK